MSFTRKSIADHLDSYDDEISELQDSKREMLADYRQQLADAGMGKAQVRAEVEALKAAMRRRRAIAKKGEEQIEEADALADEIFAEISARAPRATPAREIIEEFDAETGEVNDPDPHSKGLTAGGPNPSLDADGAKSDGLSIAGQGGHEPVHQNIESGQQSASAAQDDNPVVSASGASATISRRINPNCRRAAKGDQCALMHSQALCSTCQRVVDESKRAA